MFIDTHAHLYLEQFDADQGEVIARAKQAGIEKILLPNIDQSTTGAMKKLCAAYPGICLPMIGLHPCSVNQNYESELAHIEDELSQSEYCAIGETGIDLYWDTTYKDLQIMAFEQQIQWSKETDLPIVIHSRDSLDLTISLIEKHQNGNLKGVFHCFNGTEEQAKRVEEIGFMMGLGGVVTFKKANLGSMVASLSKRNIILETDAPYLSPTPHRGKRNESSYIPVIAEKVAEFRAESINEVMHYTSANAKKLFAI